MLFGQVRKKNERLTKNICILLLITLSKQLLLSAVIPSIHFTTKPSIEGSGAINRLDLAGVVQLRTAVNGPSVSIVPAGSLPVNNSVYPKLDAFHANPKFLMLHVTFITEVEHV